MHAKNINQMNTFANENMPLANTLVCDDTVYTLRTFN